MEDTAEFGRDMGGVYMCTGDIGFMLGSGREYVVCYHKRRATRYIGDISAASWHIGRMSITVPWHDLVSKAARYQTIQIGTVQ
jgi:hypothetical protein